MIPFRTQRIATSVVNRILNVYDGLPPRVKPGAPAAPDALPEGAALDQRIATPQPAADADPQTANSIGLASLLK